MPGETDEDFRDWAGRRLQCAMALVEACLANQCVREYIAADNIRMILHHPM